MSVVTIIPSLEIDFQTFILCGDFPLVRWPEGVVFCPRWDHRPVTDSPWCCALSYCRSMVCIDSPTKAVKGALSPSQRSQGGKFFPGILSAPWPPIKSGNAQKNNLVLMMMSPWGSRPFCLQSNSRTKRFLFRDTNRRDHVLVHLFEPNQLLEDVPQQPTAFRQSQKRV